jgi:hypothetical protein
VNNCSPLDHRVGDGAQIRLPRPGACARSRKQASAWLRTGAYASSSSISGDLSRGPSAHSRSGTRQAQGVSSGTMRFAATGESEGLASAPLARSRARARTCAKPFSVTQQSGGGGIYEPEPRICHCSGLLASSILLLPERTSRPYAGSHTAPATVRADYELRSQVRQGLAVSLASAALLRPCRRFSSVPRPSHEDSF